MHYVIGSFVNTIRALRVSVFVIIFSIVPPKSPCDDFRARKRDRTAHGRLSSYASMTEGPFHSDSPDFLGSVTFQEDPL